MLVALLRARVVEAVVHLLSSRPLGDPGHNMRVDAVSDLEMGVDATDHRQSGHLNGTPRLEALHALAARSRILATVGPVDDEGAARLENLAAVGTGTAFFGAHVERSLNEPRRGWEIRVGRARSSAATAGESLCPLP